MKIRFEIALFCAMLLSGCTPPEVAPQPAAPAQQGCNCSMTSIIFFDPGSAALSAKNLAGIQQDANFYAKQVQQPILVAGGADTQEAPTNMDISFQRAEAVAAQLEADGVPSSEITVRDNSVQHPMIPTGPGVAQIMNRYVMTRIQVRPLPAAPVAMGAYRMHGTVLYQPNASLIDRLGPNGAQPLATYLSQINATLKPVFAAAPAQPGITAALVIGVKPGGAVRTWIVAPAGAFSPAFVAQIESAAQAVPAVAVQNGPIVFAIVFDAWGGSVPIAASPHAPPLPSEWTQGAPEPETVPDGVFARIWP